MREGIVLQKFARILRILLRNIPFKSTAYANGARKITKCDNIFNKTFSAQTNQMKTKKGAETITKNEKVKEKIKK
jgi:hypothetical protein